MTVENQCRLTIDGSFTTADGHADACFTNHSIAASHAVFTFGNIDSLGVAVAV